jgi:hypothetical protein
MLEQLHKYQDRLLLYIAIGFVLGFTVGFLLAWSLEKAGG